MKCLLNVLLVIISFSSRANDLDTIGVTLLRQFDPTLQGDGVRVAQPEAPAYVNNPDPFEVNPASVGQPTNLFTYISSGGTATTFTNSIGVESPHANLVGENFYGSASGTAPQVSHVDNYEAAYFFNNIVSTRTSIQARVANQSFIFDTSFELQANTNYDNYAAQYGTIFVSGIAGFNQVDPLCAPATCYNGIGVSIFGAVSPPGPTTDGRCKPDIAAPDAAQIPSGGVSYSTAYVSGSATILVQAATRGDGGTNINAATNLLTIKALLLNGAIKPAGWTNGIATPLDARYGAGIVNVFNSWKQLSAGQHSFIESTTVGPDVVHPSGANASNEPELVGWDNNSISTSASQDSINHYYFNLPGMDSYTLTATLVWNKQKYKTSINDLNLFLYDTSNSNLIASSASTLDNVEHLSLPQLAPGRYDLQVLKRGSGQVSTNETYSLAYEIFHLKMNFELTNSNQVAITWPASPAGFNLQTTASLEPPISWTPLNASVTVDTNSNQNLLILPIGAGNQFFQLVRP